jgi:hypothetical protein
LEERLFILTNVLLEEAQYIIETKDNTMPEEISISGNSYVVSDEIVDATLKWIN